MANELTIAAITGVLGIGGGGAFFGYLKDRRLAPTRDEVRADQSLVLMTKSGNAASEMIDVLRKEIKAHAEQMTQQDIRHRAEMESQAKRHSEERAEWYAEKAELREEVHELKRANEETARRLNEALRRLEP